MLAANSDSRKDYRLNHIPVILLTARAAGEDKISGLESGADDYITKPFNAGELKARIKNILCQREKVREQVSRNLITKPLLQNLKSTDEQFIEKAGQTVEDHISDNGFTIDKFASGMALSRFHLNRKIKAISGFICSRFIRDIRLRRAAQLIIAKNGNISEIALEVGFENFAYFARSFKKRFGCPPSEYSPDSTSR